jgi:hypothetical protein
MQGINVNSSSIQQLDVSVHGGREVLTMGPGAFFGERALLQQQVVRPASMVAKGQVRGAGVGGGMRCGGGGGVGGHVTDTTTGGGGASAVGCQREGDGVQGPWPSTSGAWICVGSQPSLSERG